MAATATQPIEATPQLEELVLSTGLSIPLTQISQSQATQAPSSPESGGRAEDNDNATQPARSSNSSCRKPSWIHTGPKIVNVCSVLGILLALIFGVSAWVAQDKGIAIAKESELVTLALSCSDEKIRDTSICQQFLSKYPDGPAISRRGNISLGSPYHQDSEVVRSMHMDLQYMAVYLVMMNRFLQEQNSRFQSALDNTDPNQYLTQMGDIDEAAKAFLQNMTSVKTALTAQRVEDVSYTFTAASPPVVVFAVWVLETTVCGLLACICLYFVCMEFVLILGLFIYLSRNYIKLDTKHSGHGLTLAFNY
ncbi:hypothetical protein F5Y03DRAFT_278227 [Xylaria venustula]|nr:hypothetical protein F5Y03DRAFT_278227 [Xylaria venustula]